MQFARVEGCEGGVLDELELPEPELLLLPVLSLDDEDWLLLSLLFLGLVTVVVVFDGSFSPLVAVLVGDVFASELTRSTCLGVAVISPSESKVLFLMFPGLKTAIATTPMRTPLKIRVLFFTTGF